MMVFKNNNSPFKLVGFSIPSFGPNISSFIVKLAGLFLVLFLFILILSTQIPLPFNKNNSWIYNYSLLLIILSPLLKLFLTFFTPRHVQTSLYRLIQLKNLAIELTAFLSYFFILLSLILWGRSYNLIDIINAQSSLCFALRFLPLFLLYILQYHLISSSVEHHLNSRWMRITHYLNRGIFILLTNALFFGGYGGHLYMFIMKLTLFYGALKWSEYSLITLSESQAFKVMLNYILPLSFSFFLTLFFIQFGTPWGMK